MSKVCLVLFAVLGILAVSNAGINSRIIGGDVATAAITYAVSLQDAKLIHQCAGSIVGPRWVLTAASCANTVGLKYVLPGSNSLLNPVYLFHIKKIEAHSAYDAEEGVNDIAMVKTLQPFAFSTSVSYIPLATNILSGGFSMTTWGWGNIKGVGVASNSLRTISYTSVSNADCGKDFVPQITVDETQLCGIRATGKGICLGDVGGAVVYGGRIHGVVAGNYSEITDCADGRPEVFTRVFTFTSWIQKMLTL